MDKEKLIAAYMKEYEMTREAAEKRAENTLEAIKKLYLEEKDVSDAEDTEESWDISEVLCCKCFERWIAVRPSVTLLKDLECPRCKFTGAVVETGQELYYEEIEDDEGEDNDSNGSVEAN